MPDNVTNLSEFFERKRRAETKNYLRITGLTDAEFRPTVVIECENSEKSCGRWVEHEIEGLRRVVDANEVLYRCVRCGHVRRFGLQDLSS